MSLQELTHMLKNQDKWLIAKPKRHRLMGRSQYKENTTYKTDILGSLGNIIKDTEDYKIIISAISKIIAYYELRFPQGLPKANIPDASAMPSLVTCPTAPNNVTAKSFILARIKKNLVNGFQTKNEPDSTDMGAYYSSNKTIKFNTPVLLGNINNTILNYGKYNYATDTDYITSEMEHLYIHEILHAISDNGTRVGFRDFNSGKNRGINEATTEYLANCIANPTRYSRTRNILFRTNKMTFMSNVDSACGYSANGIVNLMNLATGEGYKNRGVHEAYLLGNDATNVFTPAVIADINNVYDFKDHNGKQIQQINTFYTSSMNAYYQSKGIAPGQKSAQKQMTISYVDRSNNKISIDVVCDMYSNGVYRYSIPNYNQISDATTQNSFSPTQRKNTTPNECKLALANLICCSLNANNTSPYTNISLNYTDIQQQTSFMHYTLCAKAQDGITSGMFTLINQELNILSTNFNKKDFDSIMKKLDRIGDNLAYAIPNDTTYFSIKNTGYLNKIIQASSVPANTLKEYHNLRERLLTLGMKNQKILNPAGVAPNPIITMDGIDIILTKDKSNRFTIAKHNPVSNLSALYNKLKAYPNINTNPNADDKFLKALAEDIINHGIAFNDLDAFYNEYVSRYTIPNNTIASYISNEKYPNKSFIINSSITCKFKGKQVSLTIPVKYSNKKADYLFLSDSTLNQIQSTLQTPYTTQELNAIVSCYLGPFVAQTNAIDFDLTCDLEDKKTADILKNTATTKYIKVDNDIIPINVSSIFNVCVIGASTNNALDKYIDAHLSKGAYSNGYAAAKDKKQIVEAIRLGFNRYIHGNKLNDELLKASLGNKAYTIDVDHLIAYCVANNPNIKASLSNTPTQTKQPPQPTGTKKTNTTPPPPNNGNGNNGNNGNGNNGNGNNGAKTPQDYFGQFINGFGQFTFCPYTGYTQSLTMGYYYQLYYQYQYMMYYQYMMTFYGGFNNYPYINLLNTGNAVAPGSLLYTPMPNSNFYMPCYYNGQGYTNAMPGTNPQGATENGGNGMSAEQLAQYQKMAQSMPLDPASATIMKLTQSIKELQEKLDKLEKANKPTLSQLEKHNASMGTNRSM